MSLQTIPVVDLRDFTDGSAATRDRFIQQLGDALEDIGFFALENHGVDDALLRKAYGLAEDFFRRDVAFKGRYEDPKLKGQRGYTGFGKEHAKDHAAPDLKEFWHVGQEGEARPLPPSYPKNLWPELPEFRPVFLELYRTLERCSDRLLEACALYLGEPEGLIRDMSRDGDTILRIIHYPPVPPERHPASVRAAAHEDINLITLLPEATAPGLELLQRDGSWRPIHALKGQIVVDSGDMIQWLTNRVFKSTTHRVTNPDDDRNRRFSMPFFVHPRHEVRLDPLASCVAKSGGKAEFGPITAGQYLEQRLREIGLSRPAKI